MSPSSDVAASRDSNLDATTGHRGSISSGPLLFKVITLILSESPAWDVSFRVWFKSYFTFATIDAETTRQT